MSKWPKFPLSDVAVIERDSISPEQIANGTLYVGLENISGSGSFVDVRTVENGNLASSKFAFTSDHILYGKLRPYLRKIARPNFNGICSTDILPIRALDGMDKSFIAHFLRLDSSISFVNSRTSGANLPRISPSALESIEVPVPPLPEQRRIAAILDKAEALRSKRRQTLAKLEILGISMFLEMFGSPVTNPKSWPLRPIAKIGRVITGNTPSREVPEYFGNEIEWIKSDNLNSPQYLVTRSSEGLTQLGRSVARVTPRNSILVTCIAGSPSCIGNAGFADREVAFNQQINAIVPEIGNPHFIYALIRAGKKLIQQASTSGMKGMVSKSTFEKIMLPFPPLDLQELFASRIAAIENSRTVADSSLARIDALLSSIQHRAFRGEL